MKTTSKTNSDAFYVKHMEALEAIWDVNQAVQANAEATRRVFTAEVSKWKALRWLEQFPIYRENYHTINEELAESDRLVREHRAEVAAMNKALREVIDTWKPEVQTEVAAPGSEETSIRIKRLAARGHSTKEIAQAVGRSQRTVQRVLKEVRSCC